MGHDISGINQWIDPKVLKSKDKLQESLMNRCHSLQCTSHCSDLTSRCFVAVLQVDLKFPKNISDGARDLVSKLLRHNPIDRLSLQSVIDHPWVRSNSRRVLPPICPAKKSWAHLACLLTSHLRGVLICPPQQTLGQHVSGSLPWASNCHYSGTFYDGYKCIPTFFFFYIVQCDVTIYV